jgi:polyhydroxybutyrate depolymerase
MHSGRSIVRGRNLRLFAYLAGLCSVGFCFVSLPSGAKAAAGRVTIVSGGIPRTAILVQHSRLKQGRRPAIIMFRSSREKGGRLKRAPGFDELARSTGAVLVYPEPLAGHWEPGLGREASRDEAFVHDLIGKLAGRGIANRDKIFLVGIRSGGMMALRLACADKFAFAGVAVMGASLPSDFEASCTPPRPVPLMMVAAKSPGASAAPSNGSPAALPGSTPGAFPVEAALSIFGKAAGCTGAISSSPLPDRDRSHGVHAYLDRLNGCSVPIESVRFEISPPAVAGSPSEAAPGHGAGAGELAGAKYVLDFLRQLGG